MNECKHIAFPKRVRQRSSLERVHRRHGVDDLARGRDIVLLPLAGHLLRTVSLLLQVHEAAAAEALGAPAGHLGDVVEHLDRVVPKVGKIRARVGQALDVVEAAAHGREPRAPLPARLPVGGHRRHYYNLRRGREFFLILHKTPIFVYFTVLLIVL